jgi:hypothetical protein
MRCRYHGDDDLHQIIGRHGIQAHFHRTPDLIDEDRAAKLLGEEAVIAEFGPVFDASDKRSTRREFLGRVGPHAATMEST